MPPTKRKHDDSKRDGRGRRGRRQWRRKAKQQKREEKWESERGAGYQPIVKENPLLQKYYQGQVIIPEQEWDNFLSTMRESLPATFRITGTRSLAESMLARLEGRVFLELSAIEVEGEHVPPPQPLPWYPNRLAWQVPLTKKFIRKSPLLSKFHAFLVRENNQGNITRQEAVSMIPPLLMDIHPHHKVLDMCAAPGSKTAQLIEALHAEDTEAATMPSGVVVANDADNKRCYMLVHQAKRLNSPCFMVTNHDASVFPTLYYHDDDDVRHPLYYDRVLCDVPCSGDGTLRKNPVIWRQWIPSLAPALHKLQLRILSRGLEVLSPGGRLVYSTCSLNPVEDEAVVATALKLCKGSVELLDCSDQLPGLKRIPGVTSWTVMSKTGEWVHSLADVPSSKAPLFTPTIFPPSQQELEELHLERCMRVLPHHQDTGGFFIAVLQKRDWLPWQRQHKLTREPTGRTSDTTAETEATSTDVTSSTTTSQDTSKSLQDTTTTIIEDTICIPQHTVSSGKDSKPIVTMETASGVESTASAVQSATEGASTQVTPAATEHGEAVTVGDTAEERPSTSILGRPGFQQRRSRGFKEDPYVFLGSDSDVCQIIKPYYGLPDGFPVDQLLTRTRIGKKRNIYLASKLVKELTRRNEFSVKIINIGVKVLARCDHPKTSCSFRLSQEATQIATSPSQPLKEARNVHQPQRPRSEDTSLQVLRAQGRALQLFLMALGVASVLGIETMMAFITSHCVSVTHEDLAILLREANPLVSALSRVAQDAIQPLGIGPVLFKYTPDATSHDGVATTDSSSHDGVATTDSSSHDGVATTDSVRLSCPLHLSGWVAAKSVRLYVDKNYRYHYLAMMGYDLPENLSLVTVSGRERKEEQLTGEWEEEGGMSSSGEMESTPEDGTQQGIREDPQPVESTSGEGEVVISEKECGNDIATEES